MNSDLIEPLADRLAGRRRLREWIVIACLLLFTAIAIAMTVALYYYNQQPKKYYWDRPEEPKPFIWDALDPPPPPPRDFELK